MVSVKSETYVPTELALAALDAIVQPEGWSRLCDIVCETTGSRAFFIVAYDLQNHKTPDFHVSSALRSDIGAKLGEMCMQGKDAEDRLHYEMTARQPVGRVLTEHEVYGLPANATLPRSDWREVALSATGSQARCSIKLNDIGPFLDCATSHDPVPYDGLPAISVIAEFLAPLIGKTLQTSRVIGGLTGSYQRLLTLFDRLNFGVAFCTPEAILLTANRAFRDIMKDRSGLYSSSSGLRAETVSATLALRKLIAAAASPEAAPDHLILPLERNRGLLPFILCAVPVRDTNVAQRNSVMLIAIDPESSPVNVKGLSLLGDLTKAEVEVCDLLVQGFGTTAIATERGTSTETIRSQINSATSKLACRSRLDVLRLAMASSVPLSDEST